MIFFKKQFRMLHKRTEPNLTLSEKKLTTKHVPVLTKKEKKYNFFRKLHQFTTKYIVYICKNK